MRSFTVAALTGVLVGLVVFVVCWVVGGIPALLVLRTYASVFGIVAGLIAFATRWDWRF